MKRRTKKLKLQRETLRHLDDGTLRGAGGAAENPSFQSGETYCWCTDTCNRCGGTIVKAV